MKIIEPSVELINAPEYKTLLTTIEAAGRTCYKSEDKITDGSACGNSMTLSLPSMTALFSIIRCRTITHGSAKKC